MQRHYRVKPHAKQSQTNHSRFCRIYCLWSPPWMRYEGKCQQSRQSTPAVTSVNTKGVGRKPPAAIPAETTPCPPTTTQTQLHPHNFISFTVITFRLRLLLQLTRQTQHIRCPPSPGTFAMQTGGSTLSHPNQNSMM